MRVRGMFGLFTIVLAGVAFAPSSEAPPTALESEVVSFMPERRTESYPMTDFGPTDSPHDDRVGSASWRVVEGTGNCCETYPHATPDGRVYDFGGTYIHYTENDGVTWNRVFPPTPLINGEGTLTWAPNGDILGVGWDPYSGDHLQAFKYEAATDTWFVHEMPLHTPFYDREWIAVVPGPFTTLTGEEVPYITLVKGGWPSKEMYLWSTDGLVYHRAMSKFVDQTFSGEAVTAPLPISVGEWADWTQPNTNTGIIPLGEGRALAAPDIRGLTREWSLFDPATMTWSEYRFPDGTRPQGLLQVDGAGRLHNVVADDSGFNYGISTDGGQTWQSTDVATPNGEEIEEVDFKALQSAGVAGVVVRAEGDDGNDQDLVFKLDISTDQPRLTRVYEVGLGDAGATSGLGNSVRFDFDSIGILPDGRVAVSFLDSTTGGRPALAIELADALAPIGIPTDAPH